jgi:hypothetical protein
VDVDHAYAELAGSYYGGNATSIFCRRPSTLLDDLALSGPSVLQELFGEFLEGLAQDEEFGHRLVPSLHSEAREALQAILLERYGR